MQEITEKVTSVLVIVYMRMGSDHGGEHAEPARL